MAPGTGVIYLVHHADAVGPDVDPQRPLSLAGRVHADEMAAAAAARGVKPVAIWHSGKLRARQTAEPFLRVCNPMAEFSAIRGLQPDDPPTWMKEMLAQEPREVMLVGHMPHLSRLLTLLVTGSESPPVHFPLHGAIALEPSSASSQERWQERWRLGARDKETSVRQNRNVTPTVPRQKRKFARPMSNSSSGSSSWSARK